MSECQTLSLNFIFRTSEQSYTMDIDIIYSIEHGRKSKDVCQNCSGSRYHRVTATPKKIRTDRTTFLLFKTPKIIKIGSRSSENEYVTVYRYSRGGPPSSSPQLSSQLHLASHMYMSCDLKLESDFEEAQNVTWGDPPQHTDGLLQNRSPSSVIRF